MSLISMSFVFILLHCTAAKIHSPGDDIINNKRLVLHSDDDVLAFVRKLEADVQSLTSTVATQGNLITKVTTQLNDANDHISRLQSSNGQGSTYVRWGRTVCEANGTEKVYSGYAAGSYYNHAGGAADYICLTSEPLWGVYDDSAQSYSGKIYGTEYEFGEEFSDGGAKFFGRNLYEHDVPCAVCRSSRPASIMIPGRNKCYTGWTQEYSGYLVSGRTNYDSSSTQFVCLDLKPEVEAGDHLNENGKLMMLVEAVCGSLKCPPYVGNRELTCVVCSK